MEQIYMIPVNEAFDTVGEKPECGCPFCLLYKKLQGDELDLILGASMMEPDIRIKTNEQGFCSSHYGMMLRRKRMLGMGLMLESHLSEVRRKIDGKTFLGGKAQTAIESLTVLERDCYVCNRIDRNLTAMVSTAVYLYETDLNFRKKVEATPYFCLPHYRKMIEYASKKMNKRIFKDFYNTVYGIEKKYSETLNSDVSWFCKKFDYNYQDEPWYNAKDSVPRAIKFLCSDLGHDE